MIGKLTGTVSFLGPALILVDVSGVGYKIHASPDTIAALKKDEEASLWTYLAVREDSLDLYGFETKEEADFFELLIGISGIGPKSGLGILSVAPVKTLKSAISSGDTSYLTKVSGIGKKTAEKIVLELRDKFGALEDAGGEVLRKEESDALEALKALGYSASEARGALKQIGDDAAEGTNERIRQALKILGS